MLTACSGTTESGADPDWSEQVPNTPIPSSDTSASTGAPEAGAAGSEIGTESSAADDPERGPNTAASSNPQRTTAQSNSANHAEQGGTALHEDEEKILIAYFTRVGNTDFDENVDAVTSASLHRVEGTLRGNTQLIAEMIQSIVGGDMFLITTTDKYPADYDEAVDFAAEEQERNHHPGLSSHVENMDDYDTIFLGFPNWWYDMPMAIYSFLEEYNFSGKTMVPFSTSGGSGFSDSMRTLRKMLPESTVLGGFTVRDSRSAGAQDDVLDWLRELEFAE
ncbi:MAG: flavodoxin [Peptococcaceae bacterium]